MEVDKYEVLEKIGHGSFGIIRKVRRKSDGYILCRKEISYLQMSQKEREQLQSELQILKNLRHPNIVAYYEREHLKASSDLHIYMEFCEDGDLGKKIREMKARNLMAEEDFVWSVFAQIVTALYRCHYGEDPPEPGRNVIGLSSDAKPLRSKASHAMILHRDLKPENIFLGADSSVKLGDFGLSKIMQSHDFASTYVGTPFYMSPEICAAEQYSLHSDIWALGCIIYELCAKEPPFNAKTHLELIQKIRLGKVKPLSGIYSQQLQDTISSCLRVNPMSRPDTVQLLNLPMVKLKRKELEIVYLGRQMKAREEAADKKFREAEQRLADLDNEKTAARSEIDNTVRREWEVKARLEIDRQIQQGMEQLYRDFEGEVKKRVAEELRRRDNSASACASASEGGSSRSSLKRAQTLPMDPVSEYCKSQSTTGETDDFPSSTDLSEISLESPTLQRSKQSHPHARTPFARAQTMFEGSPMDVQMVDPSPAPINSLGLSPRKNCAKPSGLRKNIFAAAVAAASAGNEQSGIDGEPDADDEDDEELDGLSVLPSPTRPKTRGGDPFKALQARRPSMVRQKTAPMQRQIPQQSTIFKENTSATIGPQPVKIRQSASTSPTRKNGKGSTSTSPTRKVPGPPTSPHRQQHQTIGPVSRPLSVRNADEMRQTALLNHHVQGRTLVELAQAKNSSTTAGVDKYGDSLSIGDKQRSLEDSFAVPVWDPERDEMPSPFLARGARRISAAVGQPGMRHLR